MPPDGNATPETILVIEDDAIVRRAVSDYLRECGYAVVEAASVDDALRVLRGNGHDIGVIFSGVDLAGYGEGRGADLASWLRKHEGGVDVILAKTLPRAATAAAELCNNGPSAKSYHPGAVVDRIHQLKGTRAAGRASDAPPPE